MFIRRDGEPGMIVLYIISGLAALIILLLCIPVRLFVLFDDNGLSLTVRYGFIPIYRYPEPEVTIKDRLRKFFSPIKRFFRRIADYVKRIWSRVTATKAYKAVAAFFRRIGEWIKRLFSPIAEHLKRSRKGKRKPGGKKKADEKEGKGSIKELIEERGLIGFIKMISEIAKIVLSRFGRIFRSCVIEKFELLASIGGEDAADAALNFGRLSGILYPLLSILLNAARRYKSHIDMRPCFTTEETRVRCEARIAIVPISAQHHALMAVLRTVWMFVRERMDEAKHGAAEAAKTQT